ncbi:MAG: response regulator [Terriglobales bacterium]
MLPLHAHFRYRILLVDDDCRLQETSAAIFSAQGYEVIAAANGFEALEVMRKALPELIVSDLTMPMMSGFEFLSVVRRRFPHIPVIATSGSFSEGSAPAGVLADAFFAKSGHSPEQFAAKILQLIEGPPLRPHLEKCVLAPVWVPLATPGYNVLTCTDCLRSFPIPEQAIDNRDVQESECIHCGARLQFMLTPPKKSPEKTTAEDIGDKPSQSSAA